MNPTIFTAVLSAASAIAVASLTYWLTKRREREVDWRRFKLEHYRAYITALSGVTQTTNSPENQRRYADAVNNLALVAPPDALRALYALQDELRADNPHASQETHDAKLSGLLRAIRRDVQPSTPADEGLVFRIFDPAPRKTPPRG